MWCRNLATHVRVRSVWALLVPHHLEDAGMHVLRHLGCPEEGIQSDKRISSGGIERGRLRTNRRPLPSWPLSPTPTVVAPAELLRSRFRSAHRPSRRSFWRFRFPRVRTKSDVASRVLHVVAPGVFRLYWVSGC